MCRLHIELLINSSDYLKWWSFLSMNISNPFGICIRGSKVFKCWTYNWNAISEIEMFAQRFFYYCGSSSSYIWRENMTRDNYLNVLSDKWISSSLFLSSLFASYFSSLNDYCLRISCLHISQIVTCMMYCCSSLAEYMQSNLISKECHQLYQATKYKLLKDRLFFDHKYVPILISTFFF